MKHDAIIYDLDGTIIDTRQDVADAVNATLKELGAEDLDQETIFSFVGQGLVDLIEKSVSSSERGLVQKGVQFFSEYYYDHMLEKSKFYPDALEMIKDFHKRGIPQAVFTNKPHLHAMKMLKDLDVTQYFKVILGSEHTHPEKPHTEGTYYVLESIPVKPEKALYVGDSLVDFKTAKNVGMDCVLMLDGYTPREELMTVKEHTLGLFDNFSDLKQFIDNF